MEGIKVIYPSENNKMSGINNEYIIFLNGHL